MTGPAKPYSEIQSEYIKDKIRDGDLDDPEFRDMIDALVYVEKKVENGPQGYADGMRWHHVRKSIPEEVEIIRRQLKPEKYRKLFIKWYVEAVEDSLEPDEYKTKDIIERLEGKRELEQIADPRK